ncbi:MAG: SHOCT domain-containing protein [Dehalococcoidia bacterium]|nr:SHOCT domain-containing protein [Dehalococcoidia bacterium]
MEMTTGMWVWMIAATVAWTGLLAALVFTLNSRGDRSGAPPLEIAKRRYAAGEIDRDEFNRLTSDLKR